MRRAWRGASLLGLALVAPSPLRAQAAAGLPAARLEAVESAISAEMSRREIPGLSVALVVDRQLKWTNGYGLSDLENEVPARAATVYRLGSVSKPITATAILQLSERGRLDLDTPIQKYCPAFPEKPWPITARQLLAHLGGVRHYRDGELELTRHYPGVAEGLAVFKDDPLVQEPGTKYLYSTFGYNLLGCAVEGAAGRSFADYLRENVFRPAEMEKARPDDVFAIIPNRAQGYARDGSGHLRNADLADMSYKVPGGGLIATAADVARFAQALESGTLLGKDTLEKMLTPQKTREGTPTAYGLGLTIGERNGRREAWHTGGQARVSAVLYLQPDQGLAIALLCNLEGVARQLLDLARQMADEATRPGGARPPPLAQ